MKRLSLLLLFASDLYANEAFSIITRTTKNLQSMYFALVPLAFLVVAVLYKVGAPGAGQKLRDVIIGCLIASLIFSFVYFIK